MNKHLILLLLSFISVQSALAQKFGYVDLEFITSKMPEYQKAQAELNSFSEKWAKEIQDKFAEIDKMQRAYMAEEVLLTDELRVKRQNEIKEKELDAREYNSKVFGMDGILFQKKKEIIKPVLEKAQRAIEKVCAKRKLNFLFDKSADFILLYTDPQHDYTDYVLEELGIDLKSVAAGTGQSGPNQNTNSTNKPTGSTGKPK